MKIRIYHDPGEEREAGLVAAFARGLSPDSDVWAAGTESHTGFAVGLLGHPGAEQGSREPQEGGGSMNKPEPFTFDHMPTFCVTASDDSLLDIGLHIGDVLFCDAETAPARHVIAAYPDDPDDVFHVCTLIGGKHLWDEGNNKDAPEGATVLGRVLYVLRSWVPPEHKEEADI